MTHERLPYDDVATPRQMAADAEAVGLAMHFPNQLTGFERRMTEAPAPSAPLHLPVAVSDAAAQLAGRFLD